TEIPSGAAAEPLGRTDLVVVGPRARLSEAERALVLSAEFVIVSAIDQPANHPLHTQLSGDPSATLLVHSTAERASYSVFRREIPLATANPEPEDERPPAARRLVTYTR